MAIRSFSLARRSLSSNRLRSLLILLAVCLATGVMLASMIIIQAIYRQSTGQEVAAPELEIALRQGQGDLFDISTLEAISGDSAVRMAVPRIEFQIQKKGEGQQIIGASAGDYAAIHGYHLLDGSWPQPGKQEAAISARLAARLGLRIGKSLSLEVNGKSVQVEISGRFSQPETKGPAIGAALPSAGPVLIPLDVAQDLTGAPTNRIQAAEIDLQPGNDPDKVKATFVDLLGQEFTVARTEQPGQVEMNSLVAQILLAIGEGFLILAACFVIYNAFHLSIHARRREIGALRAIGMTQGQVMSMVLSEAAWLGVLGTLIGLPLGLAVAFAMPLVITTLKNTPLEIPWMGPLLALFLGLGTTFFSAYFPARAAARTSPLQAIQQGKTDAPEKDHSAWRPIARGGGVIGLLLVGGGVLIWIFRPNVYFVMGSWGAGFVFFLAGGIIALPGLITLLARGLGGLEARLGKNALRIPLRLAASNLGRNPSRAAMTTAGMLVGLAALLGMRTLMFFWLDLVMRPAVDLSREDRLIAPNLMTILQSGQISLDKITARQFLTQPFPQELVRELQALKQAGTIDLIRYTGEDLPVYLQAHAGFGGVFVDPEPFLRIGSFDFYEGDAQTAAARMKQGQAVLLLPMVADRLGLKVGDEVTVPTPHGDIQFEVAGIGGTVWNEQVFAFDDACKYFDTCEAGMYGIIFPPGADQQALIGKLDELVKPYPEWMVMDFKKDFVDATWNLMGQLFNGMDAVLLLTILMAGFGIANTMTISVSERSQELGLLRSVGATRRQVRRAVLIEAAALGLLAALLAWLLAALALGSIVLFTIPDGMSSLGLRLKPEDWLGAITKALGTLGTTGLISLATATLISAGSALLPANRAASADPAQAARSEAMPLSYKPQARKESRARLPRNATWTMALRSIVRQRTRTLLTAVSLALGASAIVAASQVSDGIRQALSAESDVTEFMRWLPDVIGEFLGAAGVVILLAAAALVFNAFAMSAVQRRQEIGALRSLGMTRGQVQRLFLLEALITGGLGAIIGLILGPLLGSLLLALVRGLGIDAGQGQPAWWSYLLAAGLGLLTAALAALGPARQAARLSPLAALTDENSPAPGKSRPAKTYSRLRLWAGLALILALWIILIAAPPAAWLNSEYSLASAGVSVASWLVGLWLVLPWLARLPSRLLQNVRAGVVQLAAKNMRRNPQHAVLDVLNFAILVGSVSALAGMIYFMSHILLGEASKASMSRAGFAVQAANLSEGMASMDEFARTGQAIDPLVIAGVMQIAYGRADVSEEYPVFAAETALFPDAPSFVMDLRRLGPDGFNFLEGDWTSAEQMINAGCAVFMPPMAARREKVHPGDLLTLHGTDGQVDCRVAGIGSGGSTPFGLISLEARNAFGLAWPTTLYVDPRPGADLDQIKADLDALAKKYPGRMYVQDERSGLSSIISITDTLLGMFNALLVLGALVAVLGIFNSTLIGVSERRKELGLLRAVGATRRQATGILAAEASFSGLAGGAAGLLGGPGLLWCLWLAMGAASWGCPGCRCGPPRCRRLVQPP